MIVMKAIQLKVLQLKKRKYKPGVDRIFLEGVGNKYFRLNKK